MQKCIRYDTSNEFCKNVPASVPSCVVWNKVLAVIAMCPSKEISAPVIHPIARYDWQWRPICITHAPKWCQRGCKKVSTCPRVTDLEQILKKKWENWLTNVYLEVVIKTVWLCLCLISEMRRILTQFADISQSQEISRLWCICHTASLGYTLRMKTLFRNWPVMVYDKHMRRRLGSDVLHCVIHKNLCYISPESRNSLWLWDVSKLIQNRSHFTNDA